MGAFGKEINFTITATNKLTNPIPTVIIHCSLFNGVVPENFPRNCTRTIWKATVKVRTRMNTQLLNVWRKIFSFPISRELISLNTWNKKLQIYKNQKPAHRNNSSFEMIESRSCNKQVLAIYIYKIQRSRSTGTQYLTENKRIKNHCVQYDCGVFSLEVEKPFSSILQHRENGQLINSLSKDVTPHHIAYKAPVPTNWRFHHKLVVRRLSSQSKCP